MKFKKEVWFLGSSINQWVWEWNPFLLAEEPHSHVHISMWVSPVLTKSSHSICAKLDLSRLLCVLELLAGSAFQTSSPWATNQSTAISNPEIPKQNQCYTEPSSYLILNQLPWPSLLFFLETGKQSTHPQRWCPGPYPSEWIYPLQRTRGSMETPLYNHTGKSAQQQNCLITLKIPQVPSVTLMRLLQNSRRSLLSYSQILNKCMNNSVQQVTRNQIAQGQKWSQVFQSFTQRWNQTRCSITMRGKNVSILRSVKTGLKKN